MHTLQQLRSGALAGLQRVSLRCGLREFPDELFQLAEHLEILDLSGNQLSSLPDTLPRLQRLRILFCSDNCFTELPAVLGQCPQLRMIGFKANQIRSVPAGSLPVQLRWLTLTDNQITSLPAQIGACTQLQKLLLAGNQLRQLPPSLAACQRLELLRIAANQLDGLPDWLFTLPRLSWLAFGGNPFCATQEDAALARSRTELPDIPWPALQIQHLLGEGASGRIYQAQRGDAGTAQTLALKLFKGHMTSDGLPRTEMAACIAAGQHAQLIPLLGRIREQPEGLDGLAMALLGPEFRPLAGPPSLDSCTRDVYPADCHFALEQALDIATGMADVLRHLHAHGILHGDVYAHNTLYTAQGQTRLSDFGAASLYPVAQSALAARLQRLEARAFGCLLEELLERCAVPESQQALYASLQTLRDDCLCAVAARRPLLTEITKRLAAARQTT